MASNTNTQRLRDCTGISTPRARASSAAPEAPAQLTKAPQAIALAAGEPHAGHARALALDVDEAVLAIDRAQGARLAAERLQQLIAVEPAFARQPERAERDAFDVEIGIARADLLRASTARCRRLRASGSRDFRAGYPRRLRWPDRDSRSRPAADRARRPRPPAALSAVLEKGGAGKADADVDRVENCWRTELSDSAVADFA